MFIESSTVGLNSSRTHFQRYEKTEELKVQVSAIDDHDKKQGNRQHDKVALSKEAQKFLEKNFDIKELSEMKHGSERTRKLGLLKNIVEAFTGKKIKMRDFFQVVDKMAEGQDDDKIERHGRGRNDKGKAQYDVQYNRHEAYYEKEEVSFNAAGTVRTADGREISFSLDMMLSREFSAESNYSFRESGVAENGTVIDYEGEASELAGKFDFEFNSDEEQAGVSMLAIGQGFLAFDHSGDGTVNSTDEIIGAESGNAFAELAAFDEDGNGWLDENDSAYNGLSIRSLDKDGNEVLSSLKDSNVGAIHLGSVGTEFHGANGADKIERSGMFLQEDGIAAIMQQIRIVA